MKNRYIPDAINIGGVRYTVEVTEHPITLNGHECTGMIDYNAAVIRVRKPSEEFSIESVYETFVHEAIHGIMRDRDLEKLVSDEDLETLVDQLARGYISCEPIMGCMSVKEPEN